LIILAAGLSTRFGSNKLLYCLNGKPLYQYTFEKLINIKKKRKDVKSIIIVTRYREIAAEASRREIPYVINDHSEEGIASSLKLGLELSAAQKSGNCDDEISYAFFVADQPNLRAETIEGLFDAFAESGKGIACVKAGEKPGNPVVFSERSKEELLSLKGDTGGKQLFRRYPDDVLYYSADPLETSDIDTPGDFKV